MSLIAESLKRASEEWDPDRYKTVDHILNRPLPLQYSNFRPHRILRNIVFSGGLLLGVVLVGFLVVGGSFDDGPVQVQVPPAPLEKIPVSTKSPVKKKGTAPAPESALVDRMTPSEENKTVVIKNKPVIKPQRTVRKETVTVENGFAVQPQATGQPTQAEPNRVSRMAASSAPEEGGAVNFREVSPSRKVRVKVQARASVPERKKLLEEKDLFHDSEYYFNLAVYYQQNKNYIKALELYDKALQLDPANARTYNNQSLIYQELGNKDKAIEGFLKAIRLDSGYGKAYNNMGLTYYKEGNYSSAVTNFEKAMALDENNLESYNNLAIVYKKLNRLNEAKALYKRILTLVPSHAEASYNLALLFEDEGNIDSAVKFYRRFVKMGANSHPSLVSKVRNHLKALK